MLRIYTTTQPTYTHTLSSSLRNLLMLIEALKLAVFVSVLVVVGGAFGAFESKIKDNDEGIGIYIKW
jgi:hypothetical protein